MPSKPPADRTLAQPPRERRRPSARRGVITLWTILFLPVLLVLLFVVVEGVNLWLARVELENALEASALAAVKEWAESGGTPSSGWTDGARGVGQQYFTANTISGEHQTIEKNGGAFNAGANPNENLRCTVDGVSPEGNLIFGAITDDDPLTFDTREIPSCGGPGSLQFDVTSGGLSGESNDNSWGITFYASDDVNVNNTLLVDRIEINLDPNNTNRLRFNFGAHPPYLSDNLSQPMVRGKAPDDQLPPDIVDAYQHDNLGFVGWTNTTSPSNPNPPLPNGSWPAGPHSSSQITFSPSVGTAEVLTITFHSYYDGLGNLIDAGFSPGDRFRFGVDVEEANNAGNWNTANGDDIGERGVQVTVYFKNTSGSPVPPDGSGTTGIYQDTEHSSNDCAKPSEPAIWEQDYLLNHHLLVHPTRDPLEPNPEGVNPRDLPCPLTSAANNDKQSVAKMTGGGGLRNYAVRAQAKAQVRMLCSGFCGLDPGPFYVFACTTAMYDCQLQRPRLIRVERQNYTCVAP